MRNKFSVLFGPPEKAPVTFALLTNVEDAVTLALAVHRASNLSHKVCVFSDFQPDPVLVLTLDDNLENAER